MFKHRYSKRVLTREIPSLDDIIPVYDEMSLTVYTLFPRWNFIPGGTHPCSKDGDEVSSRYEERKKRCTSTSSRDEFCNEHVFTYFLTHVLNMLSNFNMYEHNESQKKDFIGSFYKKWGPKNPYHLLFSKSLQKIEIPLYFYPYCKV